MGNGPNGKIITKREWPRVNPIRRYYIYLVDMASVRIHENQLDLDYIRLDYSIVTN
jgi:hypothetical protein